MKTWWNVISLFILTVKVQYCVCHVNYLEEHLSLPQVVSFFNVWKQANQQVAECENSSNHHDCVSSFKSSRNKQN